MNEPSLVHLPIDALWAAICAGALALGYGLHLWSRNRALLWQRLAFLGELPPLLRLMVLALPLALVAVLICFEQPRAFLQITGCLLFSLLAFLWGRLAWRGLGPILRWGPFAQLGLLPWLPLGLMALVAALILLPIGAFTLALAFAGLCSSRRLPLISRRSGLALLAAVLLALGYCMPPLRSWGAPLGSVLFLAGMGFECIRLTHWAQRSTPAASGAAERPYVILPARPAGLVTAPRRWRAVKRLLQGAGHSGAEL